MTGSPFPLPALARELDQWEREGRRAHFWWRDDDAVMATSGLDRLRRLADEAGATVALGVVPEHARPDVVRVAADAGFPIWQHGWGHHFHHDGEFGPGRPLGALLDDAGRGQRALDDLCGPAGWERVFVPPNHALALSFKALLPELGYLGLSAGIPLTPPQPHLPECNAEIDVMDWHAGTMLAPDQLDAALASQLIARRIGAVDRDTPVGLLTHHLRFDASTWEGVQGLVRWITAHAGCRFVPPPTDWPALGPVARGAAREITVVLTSCGRQDLLARTLESFLRHNTHPVRRILVIEDGDAAINRPLESRFAGRGIDWRATGHRRGQIAAIDEAYRLVDTEFIFHCEDDWEFHASGFIERSLAVLDKNPRILQVWLRALDDTNNSHVIPRDFLAGGVPYRVIQPGLHTEEWGTWHGFSLNPGLRRRADYLMLGSFGQLATRPAMPAWEVEREASEWYFRRGFLAAILSDRGGQGYVRHLGWGRRVGDSGHASGQVGTTG